MKILQIGKFYPIRGGVEKVMWDLTEGLAAQGVACDMLCCMRKGAAIDEKDLPLYRMEDGLHTFRFSGGSRVICVPSMGKLAGTMISPAMVRWLRSHQAAYDIIHIHHPDPMAALALRLSRFKGKVVLHWHSDIVSQRLLLKLYQPLQAWLIGRAAVIVGTTPVYLEASPWLKGVQEKCRAVPIGIRPVPVAPEREVAIRKRFENNVLILSIGRLVPYKGFSCLIDAMRYLPESFHLVIGGGGPLREPLAKQIETNGLSQRVFLEGYLPAEDIPAWFRAAQVFVLSSVLKTEAFGIVQIEAMSCGTPVVSTRIPGSGVAWVNQDGVSGRTVLPENPKALADAILDIVSQRKHFSEGASRLFEARYTLRQMVDAMQEIYRQK